MKQGACEKYRSAVRRLGRSGGVDEELAIHARSCPTCAEELRVTVWLGSLARETPARPLPSAGQLWWKAQIIRRLVAKETAAERATRPVRWTQWAGLGLLGLLVPILLAWLVGSLVGAVLPDGAEALLGTSGQRWLLAVLAIGTGLPIIGFAVLWVLWREA